MSCRLDSRNLFPLLDSIENTYEAAKRHSKEVDEFLGFEIQKIEAELLLQNGNQKNSHWIGLAPETLQTPYTEIRFMLSKLNLRPGERVVDLGAGYGRMGLVMGAHYPENDFLGLEVVEARAREGNRILKNQACTRASLECVDIAKAGFFLPAAQVYFLYDFSSDAYQIENLILKLKNQAAIAPLKVIGRGRSVRDRIERLEPWLSQVIAPQHFGNFSIYQSS